MATKCLCCFEEEKHKVWVVESIKFGIASYDVITDIIFYATLSDLEKDLPVGQACLAFLMISLVVFSCVLLSKVCHMCVRMDDDDYEGAIPTRKGCVWISMFSPQGAGVLVFSPSDADDQKKKNNRSYPRMFLYRWWLQAYGTCGSVFTFLLEDIPQFTIVMVLRYGNFDVPAILSLVGIIISFFINIFSVCFCCLCFGCSYGSAYAGKGAKEAKKVVKR
jgi:hypothetical protein